MKLLLLVLLTLTLYAKETLHLQAPSALPSTSINSSFGEELVKLIENAHHEIFFAIYGLRGHTQSSYRCAR